MTTEKSPAFQFYQKAFKTKTNKDLRRERVLAARTKGRHTKAEWEKLKQIHCFRCCICGFSPVVKDHIVPIYQGGSDSIENLQPLCRTCNSRKGPDSTDHRDPEWPLKIREVLPL